MKANWIWAIFWRLPFMFDRLTWLLVNHVSLLDIESKINWKPAFCLAYYQSGIKILSDWLIECLSGPPVNCILAKNILTSSYNTSVSKSIFSSHFRRFWELTETVCFLFSEFLRFGLACDLWWIRTSFGIWKSKLIKVFTVYLTRTLNLRTSLIL